MANNSLRYFASGMIIATSIFTAIYYIQPAATRDNNPLDENKPLTEAEVQNYLTEQGYVSIPEQQYEELLMFKRSTTTQEPSPSAKPSETTDPSQETEQNESEETPPTNEEPPQETISEEADNQKQVLTFTLEVNPGMNSIQIANTLEQAGVITNSKDFEQFLIDKNWNRSIQIGSYEVSSEMSFEQLGRVITNK